MSAVTARNLDRAAWIVGRPAAEELDKEGLIRHDAWSAPKPTHFLVRVFPGTGPWTYDPYCRREIIEVLRTCMGMAKASYFHRIERKSCELVYTRRGSAQAQVTRALKCGLDATLIPCILMPVNHVG